MAEVLLYKTFHKLDWNLQNKRSHLVLFTHQVHALFLSGEWGTVEDTDIVASEMEKDKFRGLKTSLPNNQYSKTFRINLYVFINTL